MIPTIRRTPAAPIVLMIPTIRRTPAAPIVLMIPAAAAAIDTGTVVVAADTC
jgi:hypothetical protein